jgi:hypothetical protein
MCLHYPSNIPQRDSASFAATCCADYGLSLDVMYETPLGGSVERLLGKLFHHPFSKFYSWRLTLVMIEFEIVETIPLEE